MMIPLFLGSTEPKTRAGGPKSTRLTCSVGGAPASRIAIAKAACGRFGETLLAMRSTDDDERRGPWRPRVVQSLLGPEDERSLADDVLDGLTRPFKEIPPKHFYDRADSELFDASARFPSTTPAAPSA
jgi:hypothetical protein